MQEQKKDILWISTVFPEPPTDGNRMRNFNLIKNLSEKYNIHLLCYLQGERINTQDVELFSLCKTVNTVEIIDTNQSAIIRAFKRLGHILFYRRPMFCHKTYQQELANRAKNIISKFPISCVICVSPWVSEVVKTFTGIPFILDEQNVEHILLKGIFRHEQKWYRKLPRFLDFRTMKWFERHILSQVDLVTVATNGDADCLKKLNNAKEYITVSNGTDLDFCEFKYKSLPKSKKLIFTGGMSYFPNIDAIRYFLKDILPIIHEAQPDIEVVVAGKNPTHDLIKESEIYGGKVVFTGYVDDIRKEVYDATAFVVPLRIGSGSRFKILESMALGTPVIATSKGAEGLDVSHGVNILIANTPRDFKESVLNILNNETLRRNLAVNARRLVEEKYDWRIIATSMSNAIEKCIRSKHTRGRKCRFFQS